MANGSTNAKSSVFIFTLTIVFAFTGITAAQARSCVVKELFNNGGYTYVRCQERNNEFWLATLQTTLSIGEEVYFPDSQPLQNFRSKSLSRTFSTIYFPPGVSRTRNDTTERAILSEPANAEQIRATEVREGDTYTGTDENGTVVFTDDPSKAPKKKGGRTETKSRSKKAGHNRDKPENQTKMDDFSKKEQSVINSVQNVLALHCQGNMNQYREILLPSLRSHFDQLVKESGVSAFLRGIREQCYSSFTANKVTFGKGIPEIDPAIQTATVYFTTTEPRDVNDHLDKKVVEALFAYDNKKWKFLSFGSTWTGNYDINKIGD